MEEYTQVTINDWVEWKEDIRRKLNETANNFVYIGYRLKQIRESKMFDDCKDIFEFAQKEYGLSRSSVSRFIAINEKFSEGGNSLELKKEYEKIGSSKLAEMLTLSESECQLITERTTVKEIRELKNFSRQQEPDEDTEEIAYTPLKKCIIDFFSTRKDLLTDVLNVLKQDSVTIEEEKDLVELINPSECTTHKKGIIFLFMYSHSMGVKYKQVSFIDPVSMSWSEFLNEIYQIYLVNEFEGDIITHFYGEEKVAETIENTQSQAVCATSQKEDEDEEECKVDMDEAERAKEDSSREKTIEEPVEVIEEAAVDQEVDEEQVFEEQEVAYQEVEEQKEAAVVEDVEVVEEEATTEYVSEDQVEVIEELEVDLRDWKAWNCNEGNKEQILADISQTISRWIISGKGVTITANAKATEN